MEKKFTVGMATFDDFDGVVFTCQHLAMCHADAVAEVIVIDQAPHTRAGRALAKQFGGWPERNGVRFRYVPSPEAGGTSQPRNRVFAEATSEYVACVDCHVLIEPGAWSRTLDWLEENPDRADCLLQGPLLHNDLQNIATHFRDQWRGGMWGTWESDPRGYGEEPFSIPAQGLGLFAARRESWLGFNRDFRQFGGEEWYIHIKYRQAGREALCLPWLRWWHRFERPAGAKYTATTYGKVRNYVIGFQELQLDLAPIREEFSDLPDDHWEHLLADPIAHETAPGAAAGCAVTRDQPEGLEDLDSIYRWVQSTPRDLDQHVETIRDFARKVESVTGFVKRREWNAILAAARPRRLTVYQTEEDPLLGRIHEAVARDAHACDYKTVAGPAADSLAAEPIEETDMLVIDTEHQAPRLSAELERHGGRVRRFLVLRGTGQFGEHGEGGGPGLLPAMRRWVKAHPEWSVVYHTPDQYGLTILSKDPADKPQLPSTVKMAKNFASALAGHVADGAKSASGELLEARLTQCQLCPQRRDNRCTVCGCPIARKAARKASECPLGLWPSDEPQRKAA